MREGFAPAAPDFAALNPGYEGGAIGWTQERNAVRKAYLLPFPL
jgi:hypothetical protein